MTEISTRRLRRKALASPPSDRRPARAIRPHLHSLPVDAQRRQGAGHGFGPLLAEPAVVHLDAGPIGVTFDHDRAPTRPAGAPAPPGSGPPPSSARAGCGRRTPGWHGRQPEPAPTPAPPRARGRSRGRPGRAPLPGPRRSAGARSRRGTGRSTATASVGVDITRVRRSASDVRGNTQTFRKARSATPSISRAPVERFRPLGLMTGAWPARRWCASAPGTPGPAWPRG